ncbi:ATP-binding protein [Kitasatospora sp. NPDC001175]|uniref:Histidine kinase/HSP90-like ATPase domain-containing protein n=2 Tax=Streptomycetaceae TaxID=2062 RepID=A0ABP5RQK5_9ACTN
MDTHQQPSGSVAISLADQHPTVPARRHATPVAPPAPQGRVSACDRGLRRFTAFVPPLPERVSEARRTVTAALRHWCLEHLIEDAQLVTSELVTNAIRHAPDPRPIEVAVEYDDQWLSLAVRDRSTGMPRDVRATVSHENGRGLLLVGHVAESWLCETHGDGTKTVSCRLPLENPPQMEPSSPTPDSRW